IRRGVTTFGFAIDAAARRRLPRIGAASAAMGVLLLLAAPLLLSAVGGSANGPALAVVLVPLILGGGAIYGLLLSLFGVISWTDAANALQETGRPRLRD